jgi:flavin reductase (DIM6/NTAB) family NADH-FMN oxidoreductase RutF
VILETAGASLEELYELLAAVVVPRPIALVSTVSAGGVRNLAPYSSFLPLSARPPLLAFAPTSETGRDKDTVANIRATGEFVVNLVAAPMARAMNLAGGDYAPEVDEFTRAGLTPVASAIVSAPRVAGSPAAFECRLVETHRYGTHPVVTTFIVGEILAVHLLDGADFMSSPPPLLGQLGLDRYCDTSRVFALP